MTPFRALHGRDPPQLFRFSSEPSSVDDVSQLLLQRDGILEELKQNLSTAQTRMKQQADRKRREVVLQDGDEVFVKLQPYRYRSLAKKLNEKLSPRFYGPYAILERVGEVAYRLDLPPEAKIHPVFHISQLKPAIGQLQAQPLPPCLNVDMELELSPERVKARRKLCDGSKQVLVKWKDLDDCDSTWEEVRIIQEQFPSFSLEDKGLVQGAGNDRTQGEEAAHTPSVPDKPLLVYKRRIREGGRGLFTLITDSADSSSDRGGMVVE